jgi:hypothetical protein
VKLKFYQRILVLLALFFIVILIWKFEPGCIVQEIANISCPTCGMTRAFLALLNGDIKASFNYHPMLWSVPILILMFLFYEKFFTGKIKNFFVFLLILILAGFFINYLFMF